jgi:hypothetical protein
MYLQIYNGYVTKQISKIKTVIYSKNNHYVHSIYLNEIPLQAI